MVARVVIDGPPITSFLRGKRMEKAAEKVLALAFKKWPSGQYAKFMVTHGGFLISELPPGLSGRSGWDSVDRDIDLIIKAAAEPVVKRVVNAGVLALANGKAEYLTIGIDLKGRNERLAELVCLIRCADGRILGWTGKSYPTGGHQERALIHVKDLESHCVRVPGDRVLVLGCHDLNMFSPRGWHNQNRNSKRRKRCERMRGLTFKFKPTVILQHPHGTDSPRIWLLPWRQLEQELKLRDWASGICFHNVHGGDPRETLGDVLSATRHPQSGLDIMFTTAGGKIKGPVFLP